MVQGRLYQDAFYLVAFATSAIVLAIKLNWHSSREGFWLTALILGIADIPFIVFVLGPGYVGLWPGIQGPAQWILGMISPAWASYTQLRQRAPQRNSRVWMSSGGAFCRNARRNTALGRVWAVSCIHVP